MKDLKSHFKLSVIIPIYNEEQCIIKLVEELEKYISPITDSFEIMFIDDCSTDDSLILLESLNKEKNYIKTISLSKNMGHQVAITCGLNSAQGDVVIMMDGDLQHPPKLIPELINKWKEGFDVVHTIRKRTSKIGFVEGLLSKSFYRFFNSISEVKITPDSADFRLLSRRVVDALNSMQEHLKFYRGMIPYIGFSQTSIEFECPERYAGERSYTIKKSLDLALNGFFSFSTLGLRIPLYAGAFILCFISCYFLISTVLILTGVTTLESGWLSLTSLIFLSLGLQLTSIGVFGLYIGKIFIETKKRPLYFVKHNIGF